MNDRKCILLIDDRQTVFHLLEAILRIMGHHLLYAGSGQQGITMARQEQPDLVLLDIMMPDIDGFRICQYLKDNIDTRDIPVLFLVARDAEEDMAAGRRAGADGFMTKPFRAKEVISQIEKALAYLAQK
jgi:DNA-binding response OmpR family regulator